MNSADRKSLIAIPIVLVVGGGIAYAGSQGSGIVFGLPLFALCVALAFLIQWIAFIPAFLNKTEKYFDLTGSITYISVTILAIAFSPQRDVRAFLLLGMVVVWAARLGRFLFKRIQAEGEDRRFHEIKQSFSRFLLTWTLQGLWVSFSLAAALAAITAAKRVDLGPLAIAGFFVWVIGFVIEVVADRQKIEFRGEPENAGQFIRSGLWSWSRHPNYFGEIVLWIGVAMIAYPGLSGWSYLTLISPVFIFFLLTRISGIPMLEKRANEKWGGQAEYESYKEHTSVLIIMPPSDQK